MAEDKIKRFPKTKRLTNEQVLLLWDQAESAIKAMLEAEQELEPEHVCLVCGSDTFQDHQAACICGTFRLLRQQVERIQDRLEREYPEAFEDGDDHSAETESTEV